MGMMALLVATGFVFRKTGIITKEGKKCLTDIILYAILPCNIIKAFSVEMEEGFWRDFAQVLIIAILIQFGALVIARTMYNRMKDGEKQVYQYATVCSNSGFMGNPLAEGIFGNTGLLYASIFLIPQRIVMWTAGVSYFQKGAYKREVYKKVMTHPCMIATYIGFVIMIFQITLPTVISDTVRSLSNCCTAMTMMYIGTILIDVEFKTLLNAKQVYFALIRLVIIPMIVFVGCLIANVDSLAAGVCTLLSGTPAGSTTSLLAAKYEADEVSAAKCVVLTTALSMITIPIWSAVLLSRI
jgi:hypothetical protein